MKVRKISDYKHYSDEKFHISRCQIDNGPKFVETMSDISCAAPNVYNKVKQLLSNSQKIDGLIIDCFGDPGLRLIRDNFDLTVIGAGEVSMRLAKQLIKLKQRTALITYSL